MKIDWKKVHEERGCQGCEYVDAANVDRQAACTYPGRIVADRKTGACATREAAAHQGGATEEAP